MGDKPLLLLSAGQQPWVFPAKWGVGGCEAGAAYVSWAGAPAVDLGSMKLRARV